MLRHIRPTIGVRSSIPGRMRLQIEALRDRPRKAAVVALTLRQAPGILSVEATPRTARLLVHYDPGLSVSAVTTLVRTALAAPSLSLEAYHTQQTAEHHIEEHVHHTHAAGCTHDHDAHEHDMQGYVRNLWLGGTVLLGRIWLAPQARTKQPVGDSPGPPLAANTMAPCRCDPTLGTWPPGGRCSRPTRQ